MAKIYGLNGALRGRQGNNVFAVQNGTQIVRAYQPVVANPRTSAQQLVRAKFALAGKISGFTPSLAVAGMRGSSARSRRAAFVSALSKAATAIEVTGGYQASLLFGDFVFSQGSLPKWSQDITPTAVLSTGGQIVVTVPGMTTISGFPAGYRELVVVGLFDATGSPLDNVQAREHSRSGSDVFRFHQNLPANAVAVVWICPFLALSNVAGMSTSNVGVTDDNTGVILSSTNDVRIAASEWGETYYVSAISLTPNRDANPEPVAEETRKKR